MRSVVTKGPSFVHADSEDSDQTGHTLILLVLSCRGSFVSDHGLQTSISLYVKVNSLSSLF